MSDRDSTLMQRREFVQTSAAATAAAVTAAGLGPVQAQAQTGAAQPKKPSAGGQTLPKRMFGKTGVEVTILNTGTLRVAGFMDRLLRLSFDQGVRFFDTAKVYGTEPGFKKWFAEMPEVRKQIFLATKQPAPRIGEVLKNIDERLAALGTDYIDLLYYHGLGRDQIDWAEEPGDEEGDRGDQENRQGAVRGLHHPRRRHGPAAPGGRRGRIHRRHHAVVRPLACQGLRAEQGHGRLLREADRPGGHETASRDGATSRPRTCMRRLPCSRSATQLRTRLCCMRPGATSGSPASARP